MSATEKVTMSGGETVAAPDPQVLLSQVGGAAPMENAPRVSDASRPHDEAAGDAEKEQTVAAASQPSLHEAPSKSAESSDANNRGETSTATSSSKGKEREDVPPAKEEGAESIMAIGPAQDEITAVPSGPDAGPVCNITLLLTSGGRHPYKIDAKYLGRRNVAVPELDSNGSPDPFSISIYTLKELILREWRSDWEAKPASPSSIRLIYFGKLLDDKEQLKTYQFSLENPNVVHMSIRPQDVDEEEPKSGSKSLPSGHGDGRRAREGRCCVIL